MSGVGTPPGGSELERRNGLRLSLRARVLLLVFLTNAVVFGAGALYVFRLQVDESERQEDERTSDMLRAVQGAIRPDHLNVAYILLWPYWSGVEDAILVDDTLFRRGSGRIEAGGIALNPVGVRARQPDFDRQAALEAIARAIETREAVYGVEGGRAVPIAQPLGEGVWGGVWFRTQRSVDRGAIVVRLLPWFLLSTLLLTLGTFFALRRLVLDPVALLAEGARRVRSGQLSVRLPEPARRDELSELVHSFNVMAATVRDAGERLEEEVRRATAQARQAEAAAMTQRRLAAMGELAAGIAHEINNPLGGLKNAAAALQRPDLPPERRERYLALLSDGLDRIGETVRRLRRFTPRETPHEPVELAEIVRDALELVRHRAERSGVLLSFDAARVPPVPGARNEIGQALLNCLSNALDALEEEGSRDPEGPRVTVRLREDDGYALLSVEDNGPGVPAGELARVQDLFYTTKEVGKGTGLGLPLVHATLARHGGSVRVESEPGRGFVVLLRFPLPAREAVP